MMMMMMMMMMMNFIKVSCLISQAQCLSNWGGCKVLT